jgi:lysophospholipase L1-like esterase
VSLVGGWAKGGAKIAEMVTHVTAAGTDVTVIAAGTNDLGDVWGTPVADMVNGVMCLAAQAGSPRVLICAVPPLNGHESWAINWNARLRLLASANAWSFCDPWVGVRTATGSYAAGSTVDGIHPTQAASQAAAPVILAAIIGMAD